MAKADRAHSTWGADSTLTPPDTRRRGLLSGLGAAALAAVSGASPSHAAQIRTAGTLARDAGPDAALLADIAALAEMTRRHDALSEATGDLPTTHPDYKAARVAFEADVRRFHELRERIARTPAMTPEGAAEKGRLVVLRARYELTGDTEYHEDWDTEEALAISALRDLFPGAGA
jgi:hypothetical protein